ncbi:MAG: 30S ribosomal protein S5 [Candidatus Woesearchaeota archaeon]|nr:30S ribosomal protein S5 [Candidatus Woesearchaeota archaeon]
MKKEEEKPDVSAATDVKIQAEKDVMKNIPQDEESSKKVAVKEQHFDTGSWKPKTELGLKVKTKEITDIDEILDKGLKIQEAQIVDALLPNMEVELLLVGQAQGKFGGGQRRVFKQTQKKTREGNKPQFATVAVVGNKNGYVGVGYGKGKETVPAREKAMNKAKLNIFKIRRGSGSWESTTTEPHSIPFNVEGKSGSVHIKIMPAPKGKGLVAEKECQKILSLAGIQDVWTKTKGQTGTKTNLIKACIEALRQLTRTKISQDKFEALGIADGMVKEESKDE